MKERVGGPPPSSVSRAPLPAPGCGPWEHRLEMLVMVVHFLQDKPHVILPPSGKAVCDILFCESRSSFGTRHESQAEERTEEIADASPRSLEMTKIKGTALRLTPLGSWNVNPVREACRADSKTMDKAQFIK
jgi:hypothetical protein